MADRTSSPAAREPSPARSKTASPEGGASAEPVPEGAQIEVDDGMRMANSVDQFGEGDSTIDDQISSYTASLTSSVVDYPEEFGRRYHAFRPGSYFAPNDESEMDRLDFNHMLVLKTIGNQLYLAPIEEAKTQRILDIGTGTGIWAIQMGDMFPNAEIIGNDFSAIQPGWVPPNVKFEIDDVESPWVHQSKFDFIFSRYMAGSLGNWPKLMESIYDNLNPGGWVEFQDYDFLLKSDDGTLTEKHQTYIWDHLFIDAAKSIGREPCPGPKLEAWAREAGFVNVVHQKFKLPIGPWAKHPYYKDIGMCNLIQFLDGLEAFTLRIFCGVLGWSKEKVLVLLAQVRKEVREGAFHAHGEFHVVYGQKPEKANSTYTESLSSSVVDYPTENGRQYHAFRAGAYFAPNDDSELDRLDFNHQLIMKTIGRKLFLAPVEEEKTHRILDIGTGTGIWAIEAADLFPNAEIIGNDLSANQPAWVPPNVKFEVDDVESSWINPHKFDFIFCRYMAASISDWPKLMRNIYKNTNPGGWVEFQDYDLLYTSDDGSITDEHRTLQWDKQFVEACKSVGREACPGPKLEKWVKDAGFVNVVHQRFKMPIGPWPKDPHYKDIGMCNLIQILDGLEAFTLRVFCTVLGWTRDEVLVLLAEVRNELRSGKFHALADFHVVYAQKPEVEEEAEEEATADVTMHFEPVREMERLDLLNALVGKALGTLYLAPVEQEKTHRILDIGTGTGIWATEVADLFPNAEVREWIGWLRVPPNVKFEVDDVESPWLHDQKFDYIFCRSMAGAILDWPRLIQNVYENTNPGGWAEFQDWDLLYRSDDGSLTDDHQSLKMVKLFIEACTKIGREPCPGPKLEGWIKEGGFVNVVHHRYKLPIGTWPKDPYYKDIGMLNLIQVLDGLEAFNLRLLTGVLGWSREEVLVLLAQVRNELKSGAFHARIELHVAYGQKPHEAK
ncbi:Malonyl-[acyl-carrier protein] O-methyltransferase 1-like protein 5 [Colletotrichum chlorophyti]|uniref:Malonyl-[acyl-carrier protein] O-methyltransferase 1-like protein 5 n=1 Tax=Colletotrichum chlorophyti TaxID=708187 RepID=A0A1Q8RBK2_9PEZI|nr:Malonyl-[acyl-carrier protein] O-methyltransferase 1-like protein 5 [Colletotrichum chlorophyti]